MNIFNVLKKYVSNRLYVVERYIMRKIISYLLAALLLIGCDASDSTTPKDANTSLSENEVAVITTSNTQEIGDSDSMAVKVTLPKDHNFHQVGHEWIYFSGELETTEGKTFGLMYTIFQFGNGSSYPVMLGIADMDEGITYSTRMGGGNVVVSTNENGLPEIRSGGSEINWAEANKLNIKASTTTSMGVTVGTEMTMEITNDALYHGEDGFIPMGDGLPSGYYSYTNITPTEGKIFIGDTTYEISGGRLWLDHQWGDWTWAAYSWDWFSFRFDDGGSLMLFQFRNHRDQVVPGNWTYRDGQGKVIYGTDYELTSSRSFKNFPIDWDIRIEALDANLKVTPIFDDQTLSNLWEGLCKVTGTIGETEQKGKAYAELNGY